MEAISLFDDNVPDEMQEEFVRTLYRAYPDARADLAERDYPPDYIRDCYGQLLRAKVDIYLRQLEKRFPERIKASTNLNKTKNSYHVSLISNRVRMTASAVQHETDTPREAIFRADLAASAQGRFDFDEITETFVVTNPEPESPILYGILLHGPAEDNRYLPGFIRVAFLDRRMNRICTDIDLMKKFSNVVTEMLASGTEKITEKITVVPAKEVLPKQEA
jgi:hypothetical protein